MYGPHVRAFTPDGTVVTSISFLAYGTNKFGVKVPCGDLANDGSHQIDIAAQGFSCHRAHDPLVVDFNRIGPVAGLFQ